MDTCYALYRLQQICDESNIVELDDLLKILRDKGEFELMRFIGARTSLIVELLQSRYRKWARQYQVQQLLTDKE